MREMADGRADWDEVHVHSIETLRAIARRLRLTAPLMTWTTAKQEKNPPATSAEGLDPQVEIEGRS